MERVDIVVTGLDPARPRGEVIAALATRLTRTGAEIELLLEVAPAPLVRAVSPEEAEHVLSELRALGARVKTRKAAPESPVASQGEALDVVASAGPREAAPTSEAERVDRLAPAAAETASPPAAKPIVHSAAEWFGGASEQAAESSQAEAPPLDEASSAPPPLRVSRVETEAAPPRRPAREFLPALPGALVSPFTRVTMRALALAAVLLGLALALGALGLGLDLELGPLSLALAVTAASGGLGVVMQVTAASFSARAIGEERPGSLPGRLMDDYLGPGAGMFVALAVIAMLTNEGWAELTALRATRLTLGLYTGAVAIYGSLGFVVSSTNGSAFGYLDVARMVEVLRRSPPRGLVVVALGALSLGGAGLGLARLGLATLADASALALLDAGLLGTLVSLAAGIAAAATGAAMGQHFYASKPV